MSKDFTVSFGREKIQAHYLDIKSDAKWALKHIAADKLIGLDTETMRLKKYAHISDAALSPHLAKIRLLQLYDGRHSYVLDMLHIGDGLNDYLREFLETHRFIAHYAVFDMAFLKKQFQPKTLDCGCTLIAFKLLAHATRPDDAGLRGSLDAVTEGLCGVKVYKENQRSDWSIPQLNFEQLEYAALDPVCVLKIAEKMAPALEQRKLFDFYGLEKDAQHPIVDMHLNGILFDTAAHIELVAGWREKLYEAKKKLMLETGLKDITGPKMSMWLEKNLPAELLDIWPRTDTGKLKTDAITFNDMGAFHPAVKKFGQFQKFRTLTTDFGGKLLQEVNPATGRVHPKYNLVGTRTGRLSCSGPNLQQSPRDKTFRAQFKPRKGYVFVAADYSLIELRCAAELSRDKTMLKAFRQGRDLHCVMAESIAGKKWEDMAPTEQKKSRQVSKNLNYGALFGLGSKKFASYARKATPEGEECHVTEDNAGDYIQHFREAYSGYRQFHLDLYNKTLETLKVRTACGKLRSLAPEMCYTSCVNTIIQGSAAGCMLWALVLMYNWINTVDSKSRIVATVHDEMIIEVPKREAETVKHALEECMTRGFLNVFPNGITRGIADAKIGDSWDAVK